ncbi:hypothetical protein SAMN05660662_2294 [Blastococcus aurantiacus]|uniref:Uncharacterized protein n=1 Tax=Blastococcus aurantiacus TaxID=1550231 RepID=A0A1G7LG07_9ACTN|nr:hypothetical protein [Blastococcus aurantiacus]SDF48351.1 hypothetical protein SAMN05660662_2294 [Blastococcus aurantiacus]
MTVAETILVFAGAPLAVVLLLALLTIGPAARNRRPRYKPGQPWSHEPIWYEPHPEGTGHGSDHGDGETTAIGSSLYGERHGADAAATHAVSGGSSSAGGASAARAPRPAGPLGGARGTW